MGAAALAVALRVNSVAKTRSLACGLAPPCGRWICAMTASMATAPLRWPMPRSPTGTETSRASASAPAPTHASRRRRGGLHLDDVAAVGWHRADLSRCLEEACAWLRTSSVTGWAFSMRLRCGVNVDSEARSRRRQRGNSGRNRVSRWAGLDRSRCGAGSVAAPGPAVGRRVRLVCVLHYRVKRVTQASFQRALKALMQHQHRSPSRHAPAASAPDP